jgi:hypothetical protein
MADHDPTSVFGNITPRPDSADDKARRRPAGGGAAPDDVSANDEDTEPGGRRSERPERPSTADDMNNPRTGPIG